MSITIVIFGTAVASSLVATLITFILKQAFDRRLEYSFNSRLEQLKAELVTQSELKQIFIERRLDLYPQIVESIYRMRNLLRDVCSNRQIQIKQLLDFVRIAKTYNELIYKARLDLERDSIFGIVHSLKVLVLAAENLSLDLIYLLTQKDVSISKTDKIYQQLKTQYTQIEKEHQDIINQLTKLTKG